MTARTPVWELADDPTDHDVYHEDRHLALWRAARTRHPVAWVESARLGGFWSVTGHAEGSQVLRSRDLVSTEGMRLGSDPAAIAAARGRMLIVSDGADHRRLRSAHAPWFRPATAERLRDTLTTRLDATVATLVGRGPFDVVTELAAKLPTWTLCGMLGIPPRDWDDLADLAAAAFADPAGGDRATARRRLASTRIFAYFAELLEERADHPGDDMLSVLLADGGLSHEEILFNCDGLVNGGLGTTRHAVSDAVLAFARDVDAWHACARDPRLLDPAVDEILRWTCAPLHVMRTAVRDTAVGAVRIPAGDRVAVWLPACNRDETVFRDPDRFVVDRGPNPHLGLGGGPHYCVGAPVARIELRCLLETLLAHVDRFEVTGPVRRRSSDLLLGIERLDVTAIPRGTAKEGTP
jgi:cytochrome P450